MALYGQGELLFCGGIDGQIKIVSARTTEILNSNFSKLRSIEENLGINSKKQTVPDIVGIMYDNIEKMLLLLYSTMTLI